MAVLGTQATIHLGTDLIIVDVDSRVLDDLAIVIEGSLLFRYNLCHG